MFRPADVVFLSAALALVSAQSSLSVDNAVIEVFNNCRCVYYYQCDANNFVITNGETLINVRMNKNIPRIPCKGGSFENEVVCCKLNGSDTSALKPVVKSDDDSQDKRDTETNNNTDSTKITKKVLCGAQKTIINVRIFAGEDELTPIDGEFPWMAAIYKKSSGSYKFHCSGSLIHPRVILTANHYFHRKKSSSFKVMINGQITLPTLGSSPDEERQVSEIVHHPNYSSGTLSNDVALLILDEPFSATKHNFINTLCLPPSDVNLENTKCLVAGWGKDNEGQTPQVLKKVELPFVNHTHCQNLLRRTRLGQNFDLHRSFMCAGGEAGKDACKGDGGSPLMCPMPSEGNRYFQVGIVSWGIECGNKNVPGVYANVKELGDWIRGELEKRHFKT